MRTKFCIIIIMLLATCAFAITGEEIINHVDDNLTFNSGAFENRMTIHVGKEVRTKDFISYSKGRDASYAEFTDPPRDKGVKYLKIEDNMWMYLPSVDKIIKISGAMLRQSMMGSDFSYEDALESSKLLDKYTATLVGEETIDKSPCYVLDLTAKVKDVTYYQRKIWVDKATFVPLKEELFALSGKKLKVMTMGDVKRFGSRYYPTRVTISNLLRKDSMTELITIKADFNARVPAKYFTQAALTK